MEIKDLNSLGLPKKIEKNPSDQIQPKKTEKKNSEQVTTVRQGDQVEISEKAKELQKAEDEVKMARELLAKLPSVRAHVIYEALAKLKAGLYSSDQIIAEVAAKLIKNGELDDLL